jgi:predicted NUDIX family NTP pyrophosphohydrolase
MKQSAGLLPFRPGPEVLIAHPGGPVWAKRNEGAWSIVKGELVTGEEGLEAALREFTEETGWPAPAGPFRPLGETRLPSGKLIMAWAFADPVLDPTTLRPEHIEVRVRGRLLSFPEIDRVAWVSLAKGRRLLHPAQVVFLDRLEASLA